MALIKCQGCGKDVSAQAVSCPVCGHPVSVTTIEATGKRWKKMQVTGAFLAIGGIFFAIAIGGSTDIGAFTGIGVIAFLAGIVMFVWARIGAWWHHG